MSEKDWRSTLISNAASLTPLAFWIIGIAIVILALAGGITYKGWLPVTGGWARLLLALFGFLVFGFGLYLRKTAAEFALPDPSDFGIKISSPQPGDRIKNTDVYGPIKKVLPPGYSLWVFRVYDDNGAWPERECSIDQNTEQWEARNCDIGGSTGEKRVFSVTLVGPDGAALISYLQSAMERHRTVRDQLIAALPESDAPYSPLIYKRTRDMLECARVKVEGS